MRVIPRFASSPALFVLATAALLTTFFEIWRFVLLVALEGRDSSVPVMVWAQAFLVGLRFDLAIACYIVLPIYLVAMLPVIGITRQRIVRGFLLAAVVIAGAATFFIHLVDIEFFRFFNTRLNGMALQWADTPGFMFRMIWQTYPVVRYLLLYATLLGLFVWLLIRMARLTVATEPVSAWWVDLAWLPVVAVALLIGARGRVEEKAPLTWGLAYFSQYDVANQLALNPTFTFLRDAIYDRGSRERTRELMQQVAFSDAGAVVRELLGLSGVAPGKSMPRIHRHEGVAIENVNPPNVILIIMESYGSSHIGVLDGLVPYDLTPRFDTLSSDGILFTNIYSAGSHTYTGLLGTLFGYPTIYGKSIMKQVTGQNRFTGLPTALGGHGYETMFFTTHDPHFDNMQGFLMANGMDRVISLSDYDEGEKLSTLGVADHVMFDRAIVELRGRPDRRWFAALLTATNHGPWVVPEVPFGPLPKDTPDRERLNAFKYSDWALGRFLEQLSHDAAFANTIVVVTADNGTLYEPQIDLDPTQYRIPLLILPVAAIGRGEGIRVDLLGSQVDIASTVMGCVGLSWDNYTFGRDLLDTGRGGTPFAQFSDWDRIGYVQDSIYFISRLDGPHSLFRFDEGTHRLGNDLTNAARSERELFRRRATAVFVEAYFNLFRSFPE